MEQQSQASSVSAASERPIIDKLQMQMSKGDPLLSNKFKFYNSSVSLNLDDRVALMKDDTINYYRGNIVKMEERVGLMEQEVRFYKELSAKYHGKVIVCKEKIKELHQRIKHHIANHQMERLAELNVERDKYKKLKYESAKELHNCK